MRFSSFIALCTLLTIALPVSAQSGPRILTTKRSYDPCMQQTGSDRLRCEARQQEIKETADDARIQRSIGSSSLRIGLTRLRLAERERMEARNAELVERRRTLQNAIEDQDVNTRRVNYLQQYRADTYECMLQPVRSRTKCLEKVRNEVRKKMRAQSGTLRYYQNESE